MVQRYFPFSIPWHAISYEPQVWWLMAVIKVYGNVNKSPLQYHHSWGLYHKTFYGRNLFHNVKR